MGLRRLLLLFVGCALTAAGQAPPAISAPSAPAAPGVYLLASTPEPQPWQQIHSIEPVNVKTEESTLSTLAGLTTQPTVAEFIGAQAQVRTRDRKPVFCVNQIDAATSPLLVRLKPKKKTNLRDLDIGAVRANLMVGASLEQAGHSEVVPINEAPRGDGCDLLQPEKPLDAGEYAVMFGPDNLAIYAFTVQPKGK